MDHPLNFLLKTKLDELSVLEEEYIKTYIPLIIVTNEKFFMLSNIL